MKLSIVIDTSVLRKHRTLKTEEIQLLAELSRINSISFFIPEMVRKEILSQEVDEISENYDKIILSLKNLNRKSLIEENSFNKDIENIENLKLTEIKLIEEKWRTFIRNNDINTISLSSANNSRVFKDYIEGNPPFSKRKNRNDIPDAFIFHSILSLYDKTIYFICSDNNLSSAVEFKGIKVYDSIESVLKLPEFQEQIKELERLESVSTQFNEIRKNEDSIRELIIEYLEKSLPIELLTSKGIKSKGEDKLVKIFQIENLYILFDKARLYEEKSIVIPIAIRINCLIEYKKSKEIFKEESEIQLFEFYKDEIEFTELEDLVVIREPYTGRLTSALNINIEEPFKFDTRTINFSDIRKEFMVSDNIKKVFEKLAKK